MKTTWVSSTLLMLSLEALLLVAGGLSAAAVADDSMDAIRLRTGLADLDMTVIRDAASAAVKNDVKQMRPWWKCCDLQVCITDIHPRMCKCMDKVERCAKTCRSCELVEDDSSPSRCRCHDWFPGDPGPKCHYPVALAATAATGNKKDEKQTARPWKCCDMQVCTKSMPPICHCMDKVKRCAKTCQSCEEVKGSNPTSRYYRCADVHVGDPGPRCSRRDWIQEAIDAIRRDEGGLVDLEVPVSKADEAAATGNKKDDDDKTARPWKCCDMAVCTKSFPPICHCMDKVKRCAKTCQSCEEVKGSNPTSRYYRCADVHVGDPGPRCHNSRGGGMRGAVDAFLRLYDAAY